MIFELTELFANASAIIGILFLCWQARLHIRQQRHDSLKSTHQETQAILGYALTKPKLLEYIGSSKSKDEMEKRRFLQMWFNHFHVIYHDMVRGVISPQNKETWERDIRGFVMCENALKHWETYKEFYEPVFREWIDSLILTRT